MELELHRSNFKYHALVYHAFLTLLNSFLINLVSHISKQY